MPPEHPRQNPSIVAIDGKIFGKTHPAFASRLDCGKTSFPILQISSKGVFLQGKLK